jgi:GxxExxY protein
MPISCPFPVRSVNQEEFARLDYQVMRLAFDSQSVLGRLGDEVIYQNDLAARISAAGLGQVRQEVPVTVSHGDFVKVYRLDIVIADASIYELKAENNLVAEHEAQLLNYLFLCGCQRGKLLNFRPAKVQSRFVNTHITPEARRRLEVDTSRWREDGAGLKQTLLDLMEDWGGFLELPLYLSALTHFFGGEEKVVRMVPLIRKGVFLGNQRFHMLNDQVAFRLTAMTGETNDYESQLKSLLRHSPLLGIQWINMARHKVQFITLSP